MSNLFLIHGFVLDSVVIDAMHCLDLGASQHAVGNVLFEAVKSGRYGKTIRESVSALWVKLQAWYKTRERCSQIQQLRCPCPGVVARVGEVDGGNAGWQRGQGGIGYGGGGKGGGEDWRM